MARRLYRCYLSSMDAFPTPEQKSEWISAVWNEASVRTKIYPGPLPKDEQASIALISLLCNLHIELQFSCSSTWLLTDFKIRIKPVVQSSFGFDIGRTSGSIRKNATVAQALLADMSFIYQVRVVASPFVRC